MECARPKGTPNVVDFFLLLVLFLQPIMALRYSLSWSSIFLTNDSIFVWEGLLLSSSCYFFKLTSGSFRAFLSWSSCSRLISGDSLVVEVKLVCVSVLSVRRLVAWKRGLLLLLGCLGMN
jgi:hypothetical protein